MKIDPKYGDKILALPSSQVLDNLKDAGETDLKVLLVAVSNREISLKELAAECGASEDDVRESLLFWKERGALNVSGLRKSAGSKAASSANAKPADPVPVKKEIDRTVLIARGVPYYNGDEVSRILDKNEHLKGLIDECGNVLGRILNVPESGAIVALSDYLGLSDRKSVV